MKRSIRFLPVLLLLAACSSQPQKTAIAPLPSETPSSTPTPIAPSPIPTPPSPTVFVKPSPTLEPSSDQKGTLTAQDPNAQINVREDASPRAVAQHYGVTGDVVQILNQKQGDDGNTWYRVKFQSGATGWISGQFVAIAGKSSSEPSPPAASPSPASEGLTPIREPVSGSCECPYDTDKRGRSCGARSAYSRPGEAAPVCYR